MTTVDARGLACPQPVMKMVEKMKENDSAQIEVIVDNETAKENVIRTAEGKGWNVEDVSYKDEDFVVKVKK